MTRTDTRVCLGGAVEAATTNYLRFRAHNHVHVQGDRRAGDPAKQWTVNAIHRELRSRNAQRHTISKETSP